MDSILGTITGKGEGLPAKSEGACPWTKLLEVWVDRATGGHRREWTWKESSLAGEDKERTGSESLSDSLYI